MSASSAELREIVQLLREIQELLEETNPAQRNTVTLTKNVNMASTALRRYLSLASEAGLDGPVTEAIAKLYRMYAAIRMVQSGIMMLPLGPLGAVAGIGAIAAGGFMLTSSMDFRSLHY